MKRHGKTQNAQILSYFVLDVPINGSLVLLYAESILFILVSLGLGLLISAGTCLYHDSHQSIDAVMMVEVLNT